MTAAAALLILVTGLGPALAGVAPVLGLKLAPWDAAQQQQAARTAFAADRTARARDHARKALRLMPFDQPSLAIAALQLDPRRATAALNQAASLGWRDPATNILLYRAALREAAPAVAATRIDALGRISGATVTAPLADSLLAYPGGLKALADRAANHQSTGWIPPYLATAPRTAAVLALRSRFVSAIAASPGATDDGAWLREVVVSAGVGFAAAGHPEAALALWRGTLARNTLIAGALYDPGFRAFGDRAAIGGEWALSPNGPADVTPADGGGVVLTALAAPAGPVLSQAFLPPPQVDLTVNWEGSRDAVAAYSWRLVCAGGGRLPLAQSLTSAGQNWTARIGITPPPGCALAYLVLNLDRRLSDGTAVTLRRVVPAADGGARS